MSFHQPPISLLIKISYKPLALDYVLEHGALTIQDHERLCPEANCRTLQRDLKAMVEKRLLITEGATNKLVYRHEE